MGREEAEDCPADSCPRASCSRGVVWVRVGTLHAAARAMYKTKQGGGLRLHAGCAFWAWAAVQGDARCIQGRKDAEERTMLASGIPGLGLGGCLPAFLASRPYTVTKLLCNCRDTVGMLAVTSH